MCSDHSRSAEVSTRNLKPLPLAATYAGRRWHLLFIWDSWHRQVSFAVKCKAHQDYRNTKRWVCCGGEKERKTTFIWASWSYASGMEENNHNSNSNNKTHHIVNFFLFFEITLFHQKSMFLTPQSKVFSTTINHWVFVQDLCCAQAKS